MPQIAAQGNLERVETGRGGGVDLVDDAEVGELLEVWSCGLLVVERGTVRADNHRGVLVASQCILVDVLENKVVAAHCARVADVQQPRMAQTLLDVQAEEFGIWRFEVAAGRVDRDDVAAGGLPLAGREDGGWLVIRPDGGRRRG